MFKLKKDEKGKYALIYHSFGGAFFFFSHQSQKMLPTVITDRGPVTASGAIFKTSQWRFKFLR